MRDGEEGGRMERGGDEWGEGVERETKSGGGGRGLWAEGCCPLTTGSARLKQFLKADPRFLVSISQELVV